MKRHITLLAAIVSAALAMCSCSLTKITVSDVALQRISPKGMKAVSVQVGATFNNPARQVTVSDIVGVVNYNGKVLGTVVAEPFEIAPRTSARNSIKAEIALSPETSVMEVIKLAASSDAIAACTVDISLKIKQKGSAALALKKKGIPLSELLNSKK
ncbi:MAG: hypothetical protein ACI3ZS_07735 [Candidatus Cryptobacteroides sp.]